MMTAEELADRLSDDELDALLMVVEPKTVEAIRTDSTTDAQKAAVLIVDQLVEKASAIKQPITIHKSFENGSLLQELDKVTEKAFLTGSDSVSKATGEDVIVLALTIPAGTKVFELPGGAYILKRGITLDLGVGDQIIDTKISMSSKPPVRVIGMSPVSQDELDYVTTFHLAGKHDQSSHAKGGSGGGGGGGGGGARGALTDDELRAREKRLTEREGRLKKEAKREKRAERRRNRQQVIDTLLQVTAIVGAVATVVGLLHQSGIIDVNQIGENAQRRRNARTIRKMV